MATLLVPTVNKKLSNPPNTWRFVYPVGSVLAGSSSERMALPIRNEAGLLIQVRAQWADTTTPISLFLGTSDTAFRGTLDEIYRDENKTLNCSTQCGCGLVFENTDPTPTGSVGVPLLYLEVDNVGVLTPTGEILIELVIQAGGVG